ncbi:MAG: hypothetical protein KKF68_01675 [Nanoarchaeota archaeon]|nr:hypothetical protein [Nanoarchaeota archaeon]
MKKVTISLSNKTFYTLIAVGVILLLGIGVYAYGTTNPAVFGHSSGEITVDNTLCTQVTGHACGYDDNSGVNTDNQTLSVSGQTLSITSGNSITLPTNVVSGTWLGYCKSDRVYITDYNYYYTCDPSATKAPATCTLLSNNRYACGCQSGYTPLLYSQDSNHYYTCLKN